MGYPSRYSDSLRAGRSDDRIPVGARFSAPVQTGPRAHPASCTMGTGSFPAVKRPGRGADHPPPSKCRGHERVGLYLYSPSGPQWPVIGWTFTFTIIGYNEARKALMKVAVEQSVNIALTLSYNGPFYAYLYVVRNFSTRAIKSFGNC